MTQFQLPEGDRVVAFGELNNLVAGVKLVINTTTAPITNLVSSTSIADGTFPSSTWDAETPFVPPTFQAVSNCTVAGLRVTKTDFNSSQGGSITKDLLTSNNTGTYYFQYTSSGISNNYIQLTDQANLMNGVVDYILIGAATVPLLVTTSSNQQNIGGTPPDNNGSIEINLDAKTIRFFDSSGTQIRSASYIGNFTGDLYVAVQSGNYSFAAGDHLEYILDPELMDENGIPNDLTVGWIPIGIPNAGYSGLVSAQYFYEDGGETYPPIIKLSTPVEV